MSDKMSDANQAAIEELREDLIVKVGFQVEWRERKAGEHPNDALNQQSAYSLARLEENLRALPADHAMWFRLWNVYNGPSARPGAVELEQIASEHLRTYGFRDPENSDALDFLEAYIGELETATGLDVHDPDASGPVQYDNKQQR